MFETDQTAEITDKPTKPPATNAVISMIVVGSNLWLRLFLTPLVFHSYIGSEISDIPTWWSLPFHCPLPTSVLESSCQSKGRGVPGRQHHHSTPLVNRPQKITPAFPPQQQQPIGFGQVSARSPALHMKAWNKMVPVCRSLDRFSR